MAQARSSFRPSNAASYPSAPSTSSSQGITSNDYFLEPSTTISYQHYSTIQRFMNKCMDMHQRVSLYGLSMETPITRPRNLQMEAKSLVNSQRYQIFIKTPLGISILAWVLTTDSVLHLKNHIFHHIGDPVGSQHLIYGGRAL